MDLLKSNKYGGIAQLGEHLLCKQGVIGSIPIISTSREARHLIKRIECWLLTREKDTSQD